MFEANYKIYIPTDSFFFKKIITFYSLIQKAYRLNRVDFFLIFENKNKRNKDIVDQILFKN